MPDRSASERPNFLVIMSDEHGPMFSSTYGHPLVETPAMDRLAAEGATFQNAYSNSPLCVPSRLSFMTGKYVSHARAWDNGKPLGVDQMTWPWLLKSQGYDTALDGKMHMLGPRPLNGFDVQLTQDPHAATAHPIIRWKDGIVPGQTPWPAVLEAGPGRSNVIDHDDAVEEAAHAYLRDPARKQTPFALCVGFISPHFPLIVPEPYFSKYYPDRVDLPNIPEGHLESLPPAARRHREYTGTGGPYTDEQLKVARAAYFGMISFLDDKIGRLMDTLKETGLAENTVLLHTSDHGEMAGEHGMWRKMNFYEQAARVPLQIAAPGLVPRGRRINEVVSLVDAVATMLDLVGIDPREWYMDGDSLLPLMQGRDPAWKDEAFVEHLAHGAIGPRAMVRRGKWKLCYTHLDEPEFELYDLERDPGEFENLADRPETKDVQETLFARVREQWPDPDGLAREIRESQEERYLIRQLAGSGESRLF